ANYRCEEIDSNHYIQSLKNILQSNYDSFKNIDLETLNEDNLNKMVSVILNDEEANTWDLTNVIFRKTRGNPFYTINMIKEMLETKTIVRKDNKWEKNWAMIDRITILENIEMIKLKLKNLEVGLYEFLKFCSVIGKGFNTDILCEISLRTREEIVNLIDNAVEQQILIKSKEGNIFFAFEIIRDVIYESIDISERKNLHYLVGVAIEKLYVKRIDNFVFDLAHHFYEAENFTKAFPYLMLAGEKSKNTYANYEAKRYYELAISTLEDKNSSLWVLLNEQLADVYLLLGESEKCISVLEEILSYVSDGLDKAKIFRKIGRAYFIKGNWVYCEDYLVKSLSLLGEKVPLSKLEENIFLFKDGLLHLFYFLFLPLIHQMIRRLPSFEEKEIIIGYLNLSWVYALNNIHKLVWVTLRMFNFAESRFRESNELGIVRVSYGSLLAFIPWFKRAVLYLESSLHIRSKLGKKWDIAQSKQLLGFCYYLMSEHIKALELLSQAKDDFESMGDMWEIAITHGMLADVYVMMGDYKRSIQNGDYQGDIGNKIEDENSICFSYLGNCHVYFERGNLELAKNLGNKALNISKSNNTPFFLCMSHMFLGMIAWEEGNYLEAIELLNKAKLIDIKESFIKDYTVFIYLYLADAYLYLFENREVSSSIGLKIISLRELKEKCISALRECKSWPHHWGSALRIWADYHSILNRNSRAKKLFLQSINFNKRVGRKYELARSYKDYGNFLNKVSEFDLAREYRSKAYELFKEIGAKREANKCAKFLGYNLEEEIMMSENTTSF
ncbi:MAG: hypothetical protein NC817_01825, partial [Candidatus Omnitrophica bacterium]|nr:hypothetical protein [Candidatus Omnitrophota bacterium]